MRKQKKKKNKVLVIAQEKRALDVAREIWSSRYRDSSEIVIIFDSLKTENTYSWEFETETSQDNSENLRQLSNRNLEIAWKLEILRLKKYLLKIAREWRMETAESPSDSSSTENLDNFMIRETQETWTSLKGSRMKYLRKLRNKKI